VNGSLGLGHERTQGSWDLLRLSHLRPGAIVSGKLAGVFRGLGFLAVIPLAQVLAALLGGAFDFRTAVAAVLLLAALPAFWAAVGFSYGIRADRRREAVIRTCVLFGVLLVAFPCLSLLIAVSMGHEDDVAFVFLFASPPATVFAFLHWIEKAWGPMRQPFQQEEMISLPWLLFFAGSTWFLLRSLPRWLARRMEEERGE
jgi:hypothetical protein